MPLKHQNRQAALRAKGAYTQHYWHWQNQPDFGVIDSSKPITGFKRARGRRVVFCFPTPDRTNFFQIYVANYDHDYGHRYRVPCPCDQCGNKQARVLKERPVKDVKAAKLRDFRERRHNHHGDY